MFTLITWLRQYLSIFLTVKYFFQPFEMCSLEGSHCIADKNKKVILYLLVDEISKDTIWNCSSLEISLFSPSYLFNHLFITVGTHFFNTLDYNLLLFILFKCF